MLNLTFTLNQIFTNPQVTATVIAAYPWEVVVDWYFHSNGDEERATYYPGVFERYLLEHDFQQYHPASDELTPLA